jgi:hypothetical protein
MPDFVGPEDVERFVGAALPAAPPVTSAPIFVQPPEHATQETEEPQTPWQQVEKLLERIAAACEATAETDPLELAIEEIRG